MNSNLISGASLAIGTGFLLSGSYGICKGSKEESHKKDWAKIALGVSLIAVGISIPGSSINEMVSSYWENPIEKASEKSDAGKIVEQIKKGLDRYKDINGNCTTSGVEIGSLPQYDLRPL